MTRAFGIVAVAAALALAGCGGGGSGSATEQTAPRLPRTLAHSWAARADAIAAAAADGDGCRAQRLASALRDDVISAQARVPEPFRASLLSTVNRLADGISCTPPAQTVTTVTTVPAAPPEQHGPKRKKPKPPGHGGGHGHGHGHDEGDD